VYERASYSMVFRLNCGTGYDFASHTVEDN
jgi:hypothetical protein